jgi:hypothetical protein
LARTIQKAELTFLTCSHNFRDKPPSNVDRSQILNPRPSRLKMTFNSGPYSFRAEDLRFQKAVAQLLNMVLTNPGIQSDTAESLRAVAQQFGGDAFGVPDRLQKERKSLNNRMKGLHKVPSPWNHVLEERGLINMRFSEIVALVEVMANSVGLPMDRECKRRKTVLFEWVDHHWAVLAPVLPLLSLEFEGGQRVNLA